MYGGLALAIYGEPRETKDADVLVMFLTTAQAAFERIGATVVPMFDEVPFGGLRISRLSLLDGGKLNTVDLVTPASANYAVRVQARVLQGQLDGRALRVVFPEEFAVLKILSTREHDLEDARTVVASIGSKFDMSIVTAEIETLAGELTGRDVRVARLAHEGVASRPQRAITNNSDRN